MKPAQSKKGFGLLEVMAAAVVLGFLIVGLAQLQKGNRESILRVRVRDAASNIAQETIDSIAARGLANIAAGTKTCQRGDGDSNDIEEDEGLCKRSNSFSAPVDFFITVNVRENRELQAVRNESQYVRDNVAESDNSETHIFAKNIDVTVSWAFKSSKQSVSVSTVVR